MVLSNTLWCYQPIIVVTCIVHPTHSDTLSDRHRDRERVMSKDQISMMIVVVVVVVVVAQPRSASSSSSSSSSSITPRDNSTLTLGVSEPVPPFDGVHSDNNRPPMMMMMASS